MKRYWNKLSHLAMVTLALCGLAKQVHALDQAAFGNIGPVTYYDPMTGQSSPFYPIGWYHFGPVSTQARLQEMADSGSNTILIGDIGTSPEWHYSYVQHNLDWAHQTGMKVVIGIWREQLVGVNKNDPSSYTHLSWINNFKDHPALLGWQLGDEESSSSSPAHMQAIQDTAHVIRGWDPNNQLWQVTASGIPDNRLIGYMEGTDVASMDLYTAFGHTFPPFGEFSRSRDLLRAYTHQAELAANNGWAGNVTVTQGVGPDGVFSYYRFPTAGEYRWNAFSNLASAGARGLLNWVYVTEPSWYSDPAMFTTFRDQTVKPVMLELGKMQYALETGWNVGTTSLNWNSKNTDAFNWNERFDRISAIMLHDDLESKYFIVITNNGTTTQNNIALTFSDLPIELENLLVTAFTGGSSTSMLQLTDLGNGVYRLNTGLPRYGVGVYELNAMAVPEPAGFSLLAISSTGLVIGVLRIQRTKRGRR